MITRAYQNANGDRQEITLSAEDWAALTDADLANMLGSAKKPAKAAKAEEAAAPVEEAPAAAESEAKAE